MENKFTKSLGLEKFTKSLGLEINGCFLLQWMACYIINSFFFLWCAQVQKINIILLKFNKIINKIDFILYKTYWKGLIAANNSLHRYICLFSHKFIMFFSLSLKEYLRRYKKKYNQQTNRSLRNITLFTRNITTRLQHQETSLNSKSFHMNKKTPP